MYKDREREKERELLMKRRIRGRSVRTQLIRRRRRRGNEELVPDVPDRPVTARKRVEIIRMELSVGRGGKLGADQGIHRSLTVRHG
jgi:hypothetical protein